MTFIQPQLSQSYSSQNIASTPSRARLHISESRFLLIQVSSSHADCSPHPSPQNFINAQYCHPVTQALCTEVLASQHISLFMQLCSAVPSFWCLIILHQSILQYTIFIRMAFHFYAFSYFSDATIVYTQDENVTQYSNQPLM